MVCYGWNNTQICQWNRIGSPEIEPYNTVTWSLIKEQKQFNGKKLVFSISDVEAMGHPRGGGLNVEQTQTLHKN